MKVSLPPMVRTEIATILTAHGYARLAAYLKAPRKAPKRALPEPRRKVVRAAKRAEHRETTASIRAAVMRRADWRCELYRADGRCNATPVEWDHWFGGPLRRKRQAVATTWALCRYHHQSRTENQPSAAWWNAAFKEHCQRHGYEFTPHREKT